MFGARHSLAKIGLRQSAAECLLRGETLCIFPLRIVSALLSKHSEIARTRQADRQIIERGAVYSQGRQGMQTNRTHMSMLMKLDAHVTSFFTQCMRSALRKSLIYMVFGVTVRRGTKTIETKTTLL